MAKTVILLEDDPRRVEAMTAWLRDRFPAYTVWTSANSQALCRYLEEFWEDVVLISLDHDLAVETDAAGRLVDQGTGQEVAEYLARREPAFPVILHSTNSDAVARMDRLLRRRGWQTTRVLPVDDLAWIAQAWWPAVRHLLVNAPAKDLRLQAVGTFPFRVSKLVERLIAAERSQAPAQLEPAEEQLLRRWLRYVLVKTARLVAYVNWLRARAGTFRCLELPSQDSADAVVSGGLEKMRRDDLGQLALNPVALFHFHDRIREEKPAAWRSRRNRPVPPGPRTVLALRVGEARQVLPAASDALGFAVFTRDLSLPWQGQTYRGSLRWNWKTGECYVRMELGGFQDSPLAAQPKCPTLIVRSLLPARPETSGRRAWREEIPLTWDAKRGTLVSAWRLVPTTPQDSVELELSMGPSSSAQAAGRMYDVFPPRSSGTQGAARPGAADSAAVRASRLPHHR